MLMPLKNEIEIIAKRESPGHSLATDVAVGQTSPPPADVIDKQELCSGMGGIPQFFRGGIYHVFFGVRNEGKALLLLWLRFRTT